MPTYRATTTTSAFIAAAYDSRRSYLCTAARQEKCAEAKWSTEIDKLDGDSQRENRRYYLGKNRRRKTISTGSVFLFITLSQSDISSKGCLQRVANLMSQFFMFYAE
uniref:Secreted protein n=1 Tax=Ascaris lumbricoides TaxID=6252 RepID=A0A0M3IWK4_ASCLU